MNTHMFDGLGLDLEVKKVFQKYPWVAKPIALFILNNRRCFHCGKYIAYRNKWYLCNLCNRIICTSTLKCCAHHPEQKARLVQLFNLLKPEALPDKLNATTKR